MGKKASIPHNLDFIFVSCRNAEALKLLDILLKNYDRRSTPTNNMGASDSYHKELLTINVRQSWGVTEYKKTTNKLFLWGKTGG